MLLMFHSYEFYGVVSLHIILTALLRSLLSSSFFLCRANRLNQLPVSLKLLSRLKNLSFSNNALTSIDDESLKRMSKILSLVITSMAGTVSRICGRHARDATSGR